LGVGVYDRLIELGHSRNVVNAVNFGGKPIEVAALDETGKLVAVRLIAVPRCGTTSSAS
jgi:hypothetical protein